MRQKKTVVLPHLPPLVFINSPDLHPAPLLDPDQAVDNPVTARTVPVEQLANSSWISPQFPKCHHGQISCQSARPSHQCLSLFSMHLRKRREGEFDKGGNKYKPLQFSSDDRLDLLIQRKVLSELRGYPKPPSREHLDGASCGTYEPSLVGPEINCCSIIPEEINNIEVNTPAVVGLVGCCKCLPERESEVKESRNSCNCCSLFHSPSCQDLCSRREIQSTPKRIVQNPEQHGLLKPHRLFCYSKCVDSTEFQAMNGVISSEVVLQDSVIQHQHYKDAHEGLHEKTDNVKFHQVPDLVSNDNSAPVSSPKTVKEAVILVADTPECDYGLTFRQRQLRYGHEQKS